VTASEVAPVRHLEFEVTERRNGRGLNGNLFLKPPVREGDEPFFDAGPEERLVLLFETGAFPLAAPEKKGEGIGAQFVEFVSPSVVEAGGLEPLENALIR
jgi:hypothetical protein